MTSGAKVLIFILQSTHTRTRTDGPRQARANRRLVHTQASMPTYSRTLRHTHSRTHIQTHRHTRIQRPKQAHTHALSGTPTHDSDKHTRIRTHPHTDTHTHTDNKTATHSGTHKHTKTSKTSRRQIEKYADKPTTKHTHTH